ncbi:hypothetical protein [Streptosporangium sp. NPDC003464]
MVVALAFDYTNGFHDAANAGLGLTGLRERVELAGGEFEVGRLPGGGFRTSARLPAERVEGVV